MNKRPALLLLGALLGLSQCKKNDDPDPVDQLPPATQTGANTFGCLVNGQAWTPQGNNGTDNNVVSYDGNVNILTYRISKAGRQVIRIGAGIVTHTGTYSLSLPVTQGSASYYDRGKPSPCDEFFHNEVSYRRGKLSITRLDLQAGIIAGTFEFIVAKTGCDTIRVTDGRFDYKL